MDSIFEVVPLYAKIADLKTGLANIQSLNNYMQIKPTDTLNQIVCLFDKVSSKLVALRFYFHLKII